MSGRYSKKRYIARPSRGSGKGSEHIAQRRAPYYTQLVIDEVTGLPKRAEGRVMDVRTSAP